jgi:hypothetical protein
VTGLAIRQARDVEGPACRMLLPPEPGDQFSSVRLRVIEPRRRGVGSALLHAVFDQARQSGAGSVLAKVNANRPQLAAVMMAEGLRIATSKGATRIRFEIPGLNRTIKLSRRFHTDTLLITDHYRLDLTDGEHQ